jgi:hypothetical protein
VNRLHGPAATTPVAPARSNETGAGPERLIAAFDVPVGEQPASAEDDPDGHRPGGSLRAQTLRLSRRAGR